MAYLDFEVEGQSLRYGGGDAPVAGTKGGWLRCRFSADWEGLRAAAAFFDGEGAEHGALLDGWECAVPDAVTDLPSFEVMLVGTDGTRVVTTNRARVVQEVG